jgi:hypothetical protein
VTIRLILGSAGVSPAVFGLWLKKLKRAGKMKSARRRLPQPGRSRSPFPTESFLPQQRLERMEFLSRDQYHLARLRPGNQMKAKSHKNIIKVETTKR